MKKVLNKILIFVALCLKCLSFPLCAESYSWDFNECEIKDILFVLSLDSGISITADDTVKGKSDFKFVGDDFNLAFESFVNSSRLFVSKNENVWIVSRCRIEKGESGISIDAVDVSPEIIFEKISVALNLCITHDALPKNVISVHLKNKTEEEIISNICRFIPSFGFEKTETGFHVSKLQGTNSSLLGNAIRIEKNENGYKVDVRNSSVSEVLEKLFQESGKNFCIQGNAESKNVRAVFETKDFESCLEKICMQNGFKYKLQDEIYYIFPDAEAKTEAINGKRDWNLFTLKFTKAEKILPLVTKKIGKAELFNSTEENEFWAKVTESEKKEIDELIREADKEKKTFLITLKNSKASDLISKLPSSIDKKNIVAADGNTSFYFTGTEDGYRKVLEEVEKADLPIPRLKYDLLILQYDDTSDNSWTSSLTAKNMKLGDRNEIQAQLGSVMGFNLNVVSAFGIDFAASLQSSINENKTRVFADTSLYGLSGKPINFSNTSTYRYRDNNLDPETGKPVYSGVTREIISGLKLEILGWATEDGKITSTVTASVTRRGVDSSSITGNPPPTTEKTVTTEVVGKSGEPVVLSGLIQNSETEEELRTPVLSKIPLIGNLFKSRKKTKEKTQMVIYLVPVLENEQKSKCDDIYDLEWVKFRKEELCRIMNSN
ncbi:MAG: hypothetical protein HUK25_09555 [Treponema sp.]|nr:hypothetical protein [Treponema sp.]